MLYDKIDVFMVRFEGRLGKIWTGVVLAFILLILAAIYVRPECNYVGAGVSFEKLANNPFNYSETNIYAFRIMTPLISYLIGLRGKLFMVTNAIFALIFIFMVFSHFRKLYSRPADALFAAGIMTFSSVILVMLFNSGWCDILTYLAIFAMWHWRRNFWLFTLFFAVGLFNHDSVMFLLPWLIAIRLTGGNKKVTILLLTLLSMGLVMALYFIYRNWVTSQMGVTLSMSYYLQPLLKDPLYWMSEKVPYYPLGWFTAFKILWVIPIAGCYLAWKEGQKWQSVLMAMPVVLAAAQLVIAIDTTRMFTLGFMSMILALEYFYSSNEDRLRKYLPALFAMNFIVPQMYTAGFKIQLMPSTPMNLLRMWLDNKPWWPYP